MARTKQATPLRRDSEYVQGVGNGTLSRSARNLDREVVNGGSANGLVNGEVLKSVAPVTKEAGALQFLIAVGGIYGSL
jgi:solute carrier family 35 (UDP-galactose transporter), member B1